MSEEEIVVIVTHPKKPPPPVNPNAVPENPAVEEEE